MGLGCVSRFMRYRCDSLGCSVLCCDLVSWCICFSVVLKFDVVVVYLLCCVCFVVLMRFFSGFCRFCISWCVFGRFSVSRWDLVRCVSRGGCNEVGCDCVCFCS